MTLFFKVAQIAFAVLILGLGACSGVDDSDFYGYEKDFVIPEPDMVPVTPDDKPGRTVDEMLDLTASPVTVKKATYEPAAQTNRVYEREGRFGSKEKISLRKGLNIPDSGIIYSSQKRKNAEEIRSLELKKQEKDEAQAVSEEEILAQIIAPKTAAVEMIEVVSVQPENNIAETSASQNIPEAEIRASSSPDIEKEQTSALPEQPREEVILFMPPVRLHEPYREAVTLVNPSQVRKKGSSGGEDLIVLIQPEPQPASPSVEIFLDE